MDYRIYRFLQEITENVSLTISGYFANKKWDAIDCEFGPSESAEKFAQMYGAWNMFGAQWDFEQAGGYKIKDERLQKILWLSLCKKNQVREYETRH